MWLRELISAFVKIGPALFAFHRCYLMVLKSSKRYRYRQLPTNVCILACCRFHRALKNNRSDELCGGHFTIGTFLTIAKEEFRLLAVDHTLKGVGDLTRGMRDSHKLLADKTWKPMDPKDVPAAKR